MATLIVVFVPCHQRFKTSPIGSSPFWARIGQPFDARFFCGRPDRIIGFPSGLFSIGIPTVIDDVYRARRRLRDARRRTWRGA
jgi:hypothetical protein